MESLAPLIRAFYTGALPPPQRAAAHAQLISALRDPALPPAAAAYLQPFNDLATPPSDPLLLHYALHALEFSARSAYASTPPDARARMLQLCVDFVVSAYARIVRAPTAASAAPQAHVLPAHVLNKATLVAVQLGIRDWVADTEEAFPRSVLALIDQNGHTDLAIGKILAGVALASGIIEAAIDTSRKDFLSDDRSTLRKRLAALAEMFADALAMGIRISGPRLPKTVAIGAVRAVGSLVRVQPTCVGHLLAVLQRCVEGRADRMGGEIVSVLADLYGEGDVKLTIDWPASLNHASNLMEGVATGEVAMRGGDDVSLYRKKLVAYGEAVARRVIAMRTDFHVMKRLLNGLMGVSLRWAKDSPDEFVGALDAWLNIFEAIQDADVQPNDLLNSVYTSVADLCAKRCLFSTNAQLLQSLDGADEEFAWPQQKDPRDVQTLQNVYRWDGEASAMAEVARDPIAMSSVLFASSKHRDAEAEGDDDDCDITLYCSRAEYIKKCIETLLSCAYMQPEKAGVQVFEMVCSALRTLGQKFVQTMDYTPFEVQDLCTVTKIIYSIVPLFPTDAQRLPPLLQMVPELLNAAVEKREAKLASLLLQTTAPLAKALTPAAPQAVQQVSAFLLPIATGIISSTDFPDQLICSALLLILSLDCHDRKVLFQTRPPIDASVIASTSYHPVAALGIAAMTRWALVPERDMKTHLPLKWTPEEWNARESGLRRLCSGVFRDFELATTALNARNLTRWESMLAIARGAGLFKTMVLSMEGVHGNAKDAFWRSVGKETSRCCVNALVGVKAQLSNAHAQGMLDDEARSLACGVMGCTVAAIKSVLAVCSRQISTDVPDLAANTITEIVEFASVQRSNRLAHAALQLIRDQLSIGSGLSPEPGIRLSVRTMEQSGEQNVCVAAVNLLVEALKQHWQAFWPSDAVNKQSSSPASIRTDNQPAMELYGTALQGIMKGLQSVDLTICRTALLGLQSLDASRRIYSRKAAFHENGAAKAVVTECMRIMGAGSDARRESLSEEAVEVVWGVVKLDVEGFFAHVLPEIVTDLGGVTHKQGQSLIEAFAKAKERPGFIRMLAAFTNDFVFLRGLNEGLQV